MDDDLHDLFGDAPAMNARDDAADEAAARIAIGRVLSELREPSARVRVLRWAMERFGSDADAASNGATHDKAPIAPKPSADPTLAVDDLTDLFDPSGGVGDSPAWDKKT
jgi:hypothetical protein